MSQFMTRRSPVAGGNVFIGRVVTPNGTTAGSAVQATAATQRPIGIAGTPEKAAPGLPGTTDDLAAASGDTFRLHVDGEECYILLGGTVNANALVMSNASGQCITYSTGAGVWAVAEALEGGASGDYVRALVRIEQLN